MPIKVYHNTTTGFIDQTSTYFTQNDAAGFWQSLSIADLNKDGHQDIVAGNLGVNTQIRSSPQEPAELYFADFDQNGSIDPFFCFYVQGTSYPFVSRDELNDQIYAMRKRFGFYKDYAEATLNKVLTTEELAKARKLTVNELRTCTFLYKAGRFEKQALPIQAQLAPITKTIIDDFNGDGRPDLLLLGNKSDNRLKLGSMDANYGCLLTGDGTGQFTYVSQPKAGLSVQGDVKSAISVQVGKTTYLLMGAYGQPLQVYKKEKP